MFIVQLFFQLPLFFDRLSYYYTRLLKGQAYKILGTVDFLGNPLGLFNDVTGGISELLVEGSIHGFVAGVTHGLTNSAAKVNFWVFVWFFWNFSMFLGMRKDFVRGVSVC